MSKTICRFNIFIIINCLNKQWLELGICLWYKQRYLSWQPRKTSHQRKQYQTKKKHQKGHLIINNNSKRYIDKYKYQASNHNCVPVQCCNAPGNFWRDYIIQITNTCVSVITVIHFFIFIAKINPYIFNKVKPYIWGISFLKKNENPFK